MANYNFEIWDEDPRVLFVTDSISLEEKDLIEQSVMDLQNACQDYALFADEETYEMYKETIFNMAGVLAEVLGCGIITHDSYDVYTWYASDAVYPDGNVLPIVWNVGQDVYAVEVGGNIVEEEFDVSLWQWDKSNGSWTTSGDTTYRAYKALIGETKDELTDEKYGVSDFYFGVWNDLCEKTKNVLDEVYNNTGDSSFQWNERYAKYTDTLMSTDDRCLSCERFNSLRFNIESHESTGIADVADRDTVNGWYFIRIAECLNKLIEKYGNKG